MSKATDEEIAKALLPIAKKWFEAWKWYHDECRQTAAMLAGFQFGYWNEATNQFIASPETDERDVVMVVCNLEQAIVQQAVGILTQGDPIFGTYPGTSETGDAAASEAGDLLSRWLWRNDGMGKMLKRWAKGAFCYGLTPVLEEWDSSGGIPYVAGLEEPQPVVGEGGPALAQPKRVIRFKGRNRTVTLQRDQCAFDPVAAHVYDGAGFVVKERVSMGKAVALYPGKVKRSNPRDPDAGKTERDAERWSPSTKRVESADARQEDAVTIYRFYVKQTDKLPFGAEVRFLDDGTFLLRTDNPAYPSEARLAAGEQWPSYDWPVFFYCGDERENCPFGRGRILDAHGLQKTFNGDLSKIVQHHAVIANTKIVIPDDVEVEWDDEVGQIISVSSRTPHGAIYYLTPPSVPQDAIPLLDKTQGLMEYVCGVNAASNGQPSSGDQSGRSLDALQSRDSVRLDTIKSGLYATVALHMEFKLRQFREYADEPRMISVVGENERVACKMLSKTSIAGGTHVVVFNDTSLPSDPSKRILALSTLATTIAQAPDERMRMVLLKLTGLHDFAGFFRSLDPHGDRAERMKRRLLLGERPQPMPWDNPLTFKAAFDDFVCSEQVETRIEQEGGIAPDMTPDPATGVPSGKFVAKGQFGQGVLALWQRYTDLAVPAPPPPVVSISGKMTPQETAAQLGEKPQAAPATGAATSAPPQQPMKAAA